MNRLFKSKPLRFRLRTLLLLILLLTPAILALKYWINRPEETVLVRLDRNGALAVDGTNVALESLQDKLYDARTRSENYGIDAHVVISADPNVPVADVQHLIRVAQNAGFTDFKLRADTSESHSNRPPASP